MTKIIIIAFIFIGLGVMFLAMYSSLMVSGVSDEYNNESSKCNLFLKKQLCPFCKTGKESYELDKHSGVCPYIECYRNGKCQHFVPVDKPQKKSILKGKPKESKEDKA